MVDLAIVNAWILHKELAQNRQIKVLDQLRFREELSDQLRAEFIANRGIRKVGHTPDQHQAVFLAERIPDQKRKNCFRCYDIHKKEQKTSWRCSACHKPLCFQDNRKCFKLFHNLD